MEDSASTLGDVVGFEKGRGRVPGYDSGSVHSSKGNPRILDHLDDILPIGTEKKPPECPGAVSIEVSNESPDSSSTKLYRFPHLKKIITKSIPLVRERTVWNYPMQEWNNNKAGSYDAAVLVTRFVECLMFIGHDKETPTAENQRCYEDYSPPLMTKGAPSVAWKNRKAKNGGGYDQ